MKRDVEALRLLIFSGSTELGRGAKTHVIMRNALRLAVLICLRPASGDGCARTGAGSHNFCSHNFCSDDFRSDDFRSRCLCASSFSDGYSFLGGSASNSSREYLACPFNCHSHRAGDPELVRHGARHRAGDDAGQPSAGEPNERCGQAGLLKRSHRRREPLGDFRQRGHV